LGGLYNPGDMAEPSEDEQNKIIAQFAAHGIEAMIGG